MKKIKINLPQNGYDVLVGENIFPQLLKRINLLSLNKNIFFVIDKNVFELHTQRINTIIKSYKGKSTRLIIEVNEKLKSFKTMEVIYKELLTNDYSRDTLLVAIGGGIIGDVCGFVAATFSRGIQYIQIPTTLLAAVDSSVGGKTGINFAGTKNIIGAFKQPELVIIDINFLQTLQHDELLSGLGEIVKYGYLTNKKFHNYIKKNIIKIFQKEKTVLKRIINESVQFKGDVVVSDEKESGKRKMLNLGHTFAHAFEVGSRYKLKHGQAVIVGIASALYLSNKLGFVSQTKLNDLLELIRLFKDEIVIDNLNKKLLLTTMQRDKKNKDGKIKFVLLNDIGNIILDVEAKKEEIIFAIENGTKIFKK